MTRVLIFEDEPIGQAVLSSALRRLGFPDIASAANGAAGLAMFDRMTPPPDLIVCDIFMPEKDGIEIVNALCSRKYGGALILITGGDTQYLQIAETMAIGNQLKYLGKLGKPLNEVALEKMCEPLQRGGKA